MMKITRRQVKHRPNKAGNRGHVVYDWKSELFWGCANTPQEARLQNAAYMNNRRPYRQAQLNYNRRYTQP